MAISPDGKILAAGSDDNSIILYDMDTRKMISKPIRGHNGVRTSDVLHAAHILRYPAGDQMSCVFEKQSATRIVQ